jgi:hypothetical protein
MGREIGAVDRHDALDDYQVALLAVFYH